MTSILLLGHGAADGESLIAYGRVPCVAEAGQLRPTAPPILTAIRPGVVTRVEAVVAELDIVVPLDVPGLPTSMRIMETLELRPRDGVLLRCSAEPELTAWAADIEAERVAPAPDVACFLCGGRDRPLYRPVFPTIALVAPGACAACVTRLALDTAPSPERWRRFQSAVAELEAKAREAH